MSVHHNTALQPPSPPPLFDATAESLLLDTTRQIERSRAVQDAIVAGVTPAAATFVNTLLPLVQEENTRLYERQLIEFYGNVSTDEDVRNASHKAERLFSDFDTETNLRSDLYILVAAVRDRCETLESETLSTEQRRLLEKLLLGFEGNGLALSEEGRVRLRQSNGELSRVRRDYLNSCESQCALWFDREELEGVNSDVLDGLEHGLNGAEGNLRLERTQYHNVLSSADRQETRRAVYVDRGKSCQANVPLLEKATSLRQEKAQLLGYSSFAELRMSGRMEKSPQKIQNFLEDLLTRIAPTRDICVAEWRKLKSEHLKARNEYDDGKFYPWDRLYYSRKAQNDTVNTDSVREYFALNETIDRMLRIFEQIMGLAFVEMPKNARTTHSVVWHEDVRLFAVWDDSDGGGSQGLEFLGYLYMDMYTRPGKYSGFADLPIRPAFTEKAGSRKYTSTGLIFNFQKPTDTNKPCLLKHSEVVLLFHELGHGVHDLVAETEYARFHGASTAGDFNEAPSQMLEEWCWFPSTLRLLSQHCAVQTSQSKELGTGPDCDVEDERALPEDLIEQLIYSKKSRAVLKCLALLDMSLFDMAITNIESHEIAKGLDTTGLFYSIAQKVWNLDVPEDMSPNQAAEMNHFVVDGMYIYLTSQLYALDMFQTAFESDPMNREQGLRYRRTVIGKGSSEDEMEMLMNFLGRPPKPDAFYKELGLM